jgi:histidinol-phosphate aminotransferase
VTAPPGSHPLLDLAVPAVRAIAPYVPGKPVEELQRELGLTDIIKLASNENPLGPGPAARAAMHAAVEGVGLYPDGSGHQLKARLSAIHGVPSSGITLGNGSNDLLVLLAEAFLAPGRNAVYSQYCFAVYPLAVQATGAEARVAPARGPTDAMPLGHDLAAFRPLVDANTRLVFVANPNNPTGTWLSPADLHAFIAGMPATTLVVLDEAYVEYARADGLPDGGAWLAEFPNLVIVRTLSKAYGLAGVRVGYALSHPAVADALDRIRQPFNVGVVALAGALAALDDQAHLAATVELNARERPRVRDALQALGLAVVPSAGNFLLVDLGRPARPVYDALLRAGVIVRPVGNYGLLQHLRITIGTAAENDRLIAALPAALQA